MKILFEEYRYSNESLASAFNGLDSSLFNKLTGGIKVDCVGYYFDGRLNDCVLVLPKVLLTEKGVGKEVLALERFKPEDLIDFAGKEKEAKIDRETVDFLREFAVWIYRAVRVYQKSHSGSDLIDASRAMSQADSRRKAKSNTFLDILLELERFNRENQNFFTTVVKNLHSGCNRINWTRTISTTAAVVRDGAPVYARPVNRKRIVNFDEELLVIFFSVLNYCNETYGFKCPIRFGFELMPTGQVEKWIKTGYGARRLRQIRYKYFSDIALELWDLCHAFFDYRHRILVGENRNEHLLVKDFDIVFEAVIDELLGAPELQGLKEQRDGKMIDHIYRDRALAAEADDVKALYIGDSKYYGIGAQIGEESVYKQFTYARNLIQYGLDIFLDGGENKYRVPQYRDEFTEGYNIVPNFFISAKMEFEGEGKGRRVVRKSADGGIQVHRDAMGKAAVHLSRQFPDRLFDRDTLLVSHYDVNFLYVLSLYAREKPSEKSAWREKARELFRGQIQRALAEKYDFYALRSIGNDIAGERFIVEHFKELQGKLYRPYKDENLYMLALEKPEADGDTKGSDAYKLLSEHFAVEEKVALGSDPGERLSAAVGRSIQESPYRATPAAWLPEYHVERYEHDWFVIGSYHGQAHWDWITGKNDRGSLIYNVRLDADRAGALKESAIRRMRPKFVFLYEEGHEAENKFRVFRVHDYAVMKAERMERAQYPTKPKGDYFIFRFDEEVSFGAFDLARLISKKRNAIPDYKPGTPIFVTGAELKALN